MLRAMLKIGFLLITTHAHAGVIADEYTQRGRDQEAASRRAYQDELLAAIPKAAQFVAKARIVGAPEIVQEGNSVSYYYRMSNQQRCRVPVSVDQDGLPTFVYNARCN